MIKEIEQVLKEKYIDNPIDRKKYEVYQYHGIGVPRVSTILSSCIYEEYLLNWANSLGFRHKNYKDERDKSCCIGTNSHNLIEDYLQTGLYELNFDQFIEEYKIPIYNTYNSFLSWWKMMDANHDLEIIDIERSMSCPYCGGTLDMLLKVDGKTYIVDFKTSNHMTYKYFIQLAAYQYMIESYEGVLIDGGVLILWLDKKQIRYRDYVLDFSVQEHVDMANHCKETFVSMLYSYYNIEYTKALYKNIFGGQLV